jgi:DNA-binding NtrC family response regulator
MGKKSSAASLGELVAGQVKGSVEGLKRLVSPHPAVRHIIDVVENLQKHPYSTNAVLSGEPGTGKEGLAHTLHELMHGDEAPVVSVSTAGRAEADVAAELFGEAPSHKGERPSDGAVVDADGGTLVLDEVVGLSPSLQRQLLELVKRGSYRRIGELRERRVQVNVFAITDGNLLAEVSAGRFRHDLYHKLARLDLVLPPLRERPEDIEGAIQWMSRRVLADRGLPSVVSIGEGQGLVIGRDAVDALKGHRWPGNFRELEVVIERAVLLYSDRAHVTAADVAKALASPRG